MNFIRNRSNFHWGSGDQRGVGSGQDTGSNGPFPSTSMSTAFSGSSGLPKSEDPLASAILGFAEMATKLLIVHPCKVLRRQCQVHQEALSWHITPVTLMPVIFKITSREGLTTLWKGSVGNGVLWGLTSVTEIVLSDLVGLPKSFIPGGSQEKFWRHILLKALTSFVMTPFYISSFTESVRSESGIGSAMDVIVKGVDRMRFFVFDARDASKRFSVLNLAVPTVCFHTSHYLIKTILHQQLYRFARRYMNRKPESERSTFHEFVPQIFAQMTSSVCTDCILFPFETILHRMYIQGTRTLIDNLDTGLSAASIPIKYDGFFDCLLKTLKGEGFGALYAGLGALGLEYLMQSLFHQLARACFDRGSEALYRATQAHHLTTTPPLSHAANLDTVGPLSGPLAVQQMPPPELYMPENPAPTIGSPNRALPINVPSVPFATSSPPLLASPPMARPRQRDPLAFPSFGETAGNFNASQSTNAFGNPPYKAPTSSIFGRSASSSSAATWEKLPPLHLDTNDPFS